MPRKILKPGPKSRQKQFRGETSRNVKSFLGDGSTAEESAGEETFHSAELDDQTDYGLEFTTSHVDQTRRRSTAANAPGRAKVGQPSVSSAVRNNETAKPQANKERRRRKQKTPVQREKRFWKDVKHLQMRTDNLIPRACFSRLIREILAEQSSNADRVTVTALLAFQEAAEMYLTTLFQDAYCCTLHRGRVTLNVKDIELTRFLRGPSDPGNR